MCILDKDFYLGDDDYSLYDGSQFLGVHNEFDMSSTLSLNVQGGQP